MKPILLTLTLLTAALAAHSQSWTNRFHGPGYGDDTVKAIAVDNTGNLLVTGSSLDVNTNIECLTIKYSSTGTALWTNRYRFGFATALVVDTNGNVFVTGQSAGDFLTIKYSSAGVLLWTNRYEGPGNGWDQANAIALDAAGNVFVAGGSEGSITDETYQDYATIKYSSAGVPLWTNRYNGFVGWSMNQNYDAVTALALDGDGNVIVTGESEDVDHYYDFVTIKYSGAGVPLWTNRYDGPDSGYERAPSVAVDASGDVLISGTSESFNSGHAFATIKYSSAGATLWTRFYSRTADTFPAARGLALDKNGSVFVTGYDSDANYVSDYVTIKYSGAGLALWTNRYNGPANADDTATASAVDGDGNSYAAGDSVGLPGNHDFATIKYSGAGVPLGTNRYAGTGGYDWASAIAVDGSGNVFVAGQSQNGAFSDIVTIKYAAPRSVSLDAFAPSPTGGEVRALALQPDGRILVGGGFDTLAGQTRKYLGRVQPNGSLDTSFQPPNDWFANVWMLGLMPDGSITSDLEAGSRILPNGTVSPLPGASYYMIGMASLPDGRIVFTDAVSPPQAVLRRLNGDGSVDTGFEIPLAEAGGFVPAVLAQPDGAILVGFSADLTGAQNPNSITRVLANATVDPAFHAETDTGVATMVLQADGKIVIGGSFTQVNGVPRQHLARLNPNGTLDEAFDPSVVPGGGAGPIFSLALQTDGRILVAGDFSRLAGQPCSDLGRLNPDGSFDASFNLGTENFVMALAIEQDGNVLVGGRFTTLGGQPRSNLGRILNTESATQTLTVGNSSLTWLRGGSGPEVWTTTFEVSSDGTNWRPLGVGTRVSGGWQLSGISIPAGSQVRARGYVTGGSFNDSSWYVESLATFGTSRPSLSITRTTASTLTISWPSPSTGWNLEQNTTLAGGVWTTPPESVTDNGTTKSIIVSAATTGSRFFRLVQ